LESKGISEVINIPFVTEIPKFEEIMGKEMIRELESILNEYEPGVLIPLKRVKRILKQFKPLRKYFKFPKRHDILLRGRKQFVDVFPKIRDYGLRRNSF